MNVDIDTLHRAKATLLDLAIRFGPKRVVVLLIVMAGFIVGGWVARAVQGSLLKFDLEPPVRQLITRIARLLVLGLFPIMALQNLGVELLPLIAGLGVAGAALALATQGVLSNVVAGLAIIFTKPFRVGEIPHNYGRIRQAEVMVRVAYETNLPVVLETIVAALRQRGVAIPFPQREVRLISGSM